MKKPKFFLTLGISLVVLLGALSAFHNQHPTHNSPPPVQKEAVVSLKT